MSEPTWIEFDFKRHRSELAFSTPFQMKFHCERIQTLIAGVPNGAEELRVAALRRLHSHHDGEIVAALLAVYVVGKIDDIPAVERLLDYRNERVRNAAKTCLFQLKRR